MSKKIRGSTEVARFIHYFITIFWITVVFFICPWSWRIQAAVLVLVLRIVHFYTMRLEGEDI